jgi:rhomboid family GlyGly-CTERM serine protease
VAHRLSGLTYPGRAWLAAAAVLAAGAVAGAGIPAAAAVLDWQPALALSEPWRAWTAAFVHWSGLHLGANLGALAVLASLGPAGRLPARAALAWLAAWPLTHALLLLRPELSHYGGLSGVLHAGVAIAGWFIVADGAGRARWIGGAILAGLAAKLVLEAPWGPALRALPGWDIPLAPVGHATGAAAGLACAVVARVRR